MTILKAPIRQIDPYYGRANARSASSSPTVFGVSTDHGTTEWWQRKSDAVAAAGWLADNEWDGNADLELTLLQAGISLKGKWVASTTTGAPQ